MTRKLSEQIVAMVLYQIGVNVTDQEREGAITNVVALLSTAALEQKTFKNTKEAMLYAQRHNIPAVVPVRDSSTSATAAAGRAATEICDYCGVDTNNAERVVEIILRNFASAQ